MVKSKRAAKSATNTPMFEIPAAPWIYINDTTFGSYVTTDLIKLIPNALSVSTFQGQNGLEYRQIPCKDVSRVSVIRDARKYGDSASKKDAIQVVKTSALKAGVNFVSIHVDDDLLQLSGVDSAGLVMTNHLNITAGLKAGAEIYKWLFTVLTVCETLHLISDAKMQEIDTKLFPEYKYCTINDSRSAPKDSKIQFVALILTKPQVVDGKKLVWTVADKTGAANFYFQHRGESSQYTWDWVMSLKPGQRKALPRMPMVQIQERRRIRVVKAPFRAAGAIVGGTGFVLKQVGKGISNAGKALKMGSSSEWVLEADVDRNGKKIDWAQKERDEVKVDKKVVEKSAKIFDEKSEKFWDDAASDVSTEAGSETSAEKFKEFL